MKKKINIGEVIKVGLILFIITAVAAALLAFVNSKTEPLIEQNAIEKEQNAMRAVMPGAAEFAEQEITGEIAAVSDNDELKKAYIALDESGSVIGACILTETTGYDIGIQAVTGVDTNLKVTGVEITDMNETPGLGAKAADESFRVQYKNKSGTVGVSKTAADDSSIQAISGATKTSGGVTNGVNIALKAAEILMKGGNE